MTLSAPVETSRSWRPALAGVSEVFHASYTDHAYPVHCHDTWTVLIVDSGQVRYELAGHERGANTDHVTVLPPFVAHNGRSARTGRGFTKRVLYIDTATIDENLVGAAVDHSTLDDAPLRRSISRLHDVLVRPADDLEEESHLAIIVERIAAALQQTIVSERTPGRAAESLRAALDEDPFAHHSLNEIASRMGWNPTHLIRSFTNAYGLPPHRYLISRRLDEARRQLLAGVPAAIVALNVGFHDQAHLTRHFKHHLSITPGRYQRAA